MPELSEILETLNSLRAEIALDRTLGNDNSRRIAVHEAECAGRYRELLVKLSLQTTVIRILGYTVAFSILLQLVGTRDAMQALSHFLGLH